MQVQQNVVHFLPGQPPQFDLQVSNPDAETLYIEVEVLQVLNPGTEEEIREPVKNPLEADFLVTPNRFILPPNNRKIVRLVNTGGHASEERVFRVNLKPVPPPAEASQNAIRIHVAYQVLALISPEDPRPDLQIERRGSSLTARNLGNVNVLLRNGVQCATEQDLENKTEDRCQGIKARRIYPGNEWQSDLPYDAPVEFVISELGRNRRQRI
jgi:P pilus assembly chaperone PapD